MSSQKLLNIGISCYPTVGGSGVLATALGQQLALRGHNVHFISYERPFRLPLDEARIHFHAVNVGDYGLFKYPDYTLPLSVKMAEVARDCELDLLHVHYAVPHATAAILARSMLPTEHRPAVVTTLHGTDTTLLGRDADFGPAIRYALDRSDAVTAVSEFLRRETQRLFNFERPIEVVHNFFSPGEPQRSREEVRRELGIGNEAMLLHSSNLRRLKRIDLLLETVALIRPRDSFKLVILAGEDFAPFLPDVDRLQLGDSVIVREKVAGVEDYLQAADVAVYTSETESFCLSILEAMCFACPSVATRVGGIPEVVEEGVSGILTAMGDCRAMAGAIENLIRNPAMRAEMGVRAKERARDLFSPERIVAKYEALYRRVCD
jgi:N-acetyl-alpha-D-glucosaminyl L-malate synthase BshA